MRMGIRRDRANSDHGQRGRKRRWQLYSFAGVSTTITANSYKFDGTTWTAIAPLPTALEYPSAVSDGTNIYIIGGTTGTRSDDGLPVQCRPGHLHPMAPCAVASWNHVSVYLNGKIYKIAGTNDTPVSLANVEIYDIGSNTWSTGAAYPVAQSFPMAFAQGNFVYVGGGIDAVSGLETNKTYRYDPSTNTWDDAAIADLPASRWGGAAAFGNCCAGGGVFAGGYTSGNIAFSAINWDLGTNSWTSLPNMQGERTRMGGAVLNGTFYAVGGRSVAQPGFVGTVDNQKLACASTPTPIPVVISGRVGNCASPAPTATPPALPTPPVLPGSPNVLMTLSGSSSSTTLTDPSGNYAFPGLTIGGSYTVTPTKPALAPGSGNINTVDVIATQRHFLNLVVIPAGCRLSAADVNSDSNISTVDVVAIQRFFLGLTTGTANVGKYQFSPANRSYSGIITTQLGQNFDTFIFGDVASPFSN